ncbi:hypothetical protein B0T19DRAFT_468689 [Cercophora scortea]|uniref:Uncharacterized protein n=1 Tax=Cercophora scortea TaxID=314031 RepID=A0AAE0M5T8_9PEZI|nr:hypothetical protein B0T19DRAFT_468689 [Cercophora scortea]
MEACSQGLVVAILFATATLTAAVAIPGLDSRPREPIQGLQQHRSLINREESSKFLYLEDCQYMSAIGMLGQGENALEDNGQIWIGSDGPNIFTFINAASVPITLILWYTALSDDQASFMNARMPKISYSLPVAGSAVQLSIANDVPGGWAAIYNRQTTLTQYGQVSNTFGEFSTGPYATIDVSRLVNMSGDPMTVRVSSGCVADMRSCVYMCDRADNSCGAAGTYSLANCGGHNAVQSIGADGNPTGGCQGWSYGGHVEVVMT